VTSFMYVVIAIFNFSFGGGLSCQCAYVSVTYLSVGCFVICWLEILWFDA